MKISKWIALTIIIQSIIIGCLLFELKIGKAKNLRKDKLISQYSYEIENLKLRKNLNLN